MKELPQIDENGWCVLNGEELALSHPLTFQIPSLVEREGLRPGDHAKLVFRFRTFDNEFEDERMWVLVT